jgi:hypothetical protein
METRYVGGRERGSELGKEHCKDIERAPHLPF